MEIPEGPQDSFNVWRRKSNASSTLYPSGREGPADRATEQALSGGGPPKTVAPPHNGVGARPLRPAPIGARGDWTMPQGQDPKDRRRQVLVVQGRRVAVPPPPLHEVPDMGAIGQENVEGHQEDV